MNTHDLDPKFRPYEDEIRYAWEHENPPPTSSESDFGQKCRLDPFLSDSEAFLGDDGFPPDVCWRCVNWNPSSDAAEFAYCPVVRLDTAAESTCTRFEAKG